MMGAMTNWNNGDECGWRWLRNVAAVRAFIYAGLTREGGDPVELVLRLVVIVVVSR